MMSDAFHDSTDFGIMCIPFCQLHSFAFIHHSSFESFGLAKTQFECPFVKKWFGISGSSIQSIALTTCATSRSSYNDGC